MTYPVGWPEEIKFAGTTYRYSGDVHATLLALATSTEAGTTQEWLAVLGVPMDDESRAQLSLDLGDRGHPLTCLGLMVLSERICQDALGMSLYAAGRLAIRALQFWVPFAAWAAQSGFMPSRMELHELLPAVYGWQASACSEDKEIDRLNRTIFGTAKPWGR